jgi:hypothetical protein
MAYQSAFIFRSYTCHVLKTLHQNRLNFMRLNFFFFNLCSYHRYPVDERNKELLDQNIILSDKPHHTGMRSNTDQGIGKRYLYATVRQLRIKHVESQLHIL